jgi:hypothetical protein
MNNENDNIIHPNTNQTNENPEPFPEASNPNTVMPTPETQNHGVINPPQNTSPSTPETNESIATPEASLNTAPRATPLAQAPEQPQQSSESIPTQKHHNSSSKKDEEYNSNPFIVAGKGLGSALVENPTSSILIAVLPVLVAIPAIFFVSTITVVLGLSGGAIGALLGGLIALVVVIALALLLIRIAAGSINILLMSLEKEKISTKAAIGSVSSGKLTSFVGVYFLTSVAIFIGLLFFIIPGIYLMARFSLAPVVVYAENLKAMAAIKRSMALTKGHVFEMLGALTAQTILSGNGLLSTIGANSGIVKRYKELTTAEKLGITDTGKVHWLNYVMPVLFSIFLVSYVALSVISSTIDPNNGSYNDFNNDSFIIEEDFNDSFNNTNFDSFDSDINNSFE